MQRIILAIGLIGGALMLQGCNNKPDRAAAAVKQNAAVEKAVIGVTRTDCLTTITAACDAVVGEASAAEIKRLADGGKKVCRGYDKGAFFPNPTKYNACEAKLASYQQEIGGTSYDSLTSEAQLLGVWERQCGERVRSNLGVSTYGCHKHKYGIINATSIGAKAASYSKSSRSETKLGIMKYRVTTRLAELATYTLEYKAVARLYDATVRTPTDTPAPFFMISLGAATVMVMGLAALGLKQFYQNRQASSSSPLKSEDEDEDEEEAAGFE